MNLVMISQFPRVASYVGQGNRGELGGASEDPVCDDGEVFAALPQHQLPHCVERATQPIAGQSNA